VKKRDQLYNKYNSNGTSSEDPVAKTFNT